jgi:hypothetical protein
MGCRFFSSGDGGGKEELHNTTAEAPQVSQDDASSKQPSRTVTPILDCPGQTRVLFKLRQPVDLVHTLKTVKELLLLVPSQTPRSSGVCYMSSARGG